VISIARSGVIGDSSTRIESVYQDILYFDFEYIWESFRKPYQIV
jgi:hypothetical protein